jgi:hypothetical protein
MVDESISTIRVQIKKFNRLAGSATLNPIAFAKKIKVY